MVVRRRREGCLEVRSVQWRENTFHEWDGVFYSLLDLINEGWTTQCLEIEEDLVVQVNLNDE